MAEKRKRSQNFLMEEKERLVKLLSKHKESILNKRTDGTSNKAKANAWLQLTNRFNSEGSIYRSKESLIKMWEKLKSESKIYYTASRSESTQDGEGPPIQKVDPFLEKVCSMVLGYTSAPDSDWAETAQEPEITDQDNSVMENQPKVVVLNYGDENIFLGGLRNKEPKYKKAKVADDDDDVTRETPDKEDAEELKRLLLIDKIYFQRKLYELQLQSAQKEVEIKEEILQKIRGTY